MNGSTDAATRATIGYHAAREVALGEALAALPAHSWTVISNVAWPDRHGSVIDFVVVGPPGVFVVDDQLLVGNVTLHDSVLRHNGRNRSSVIGEAFGAARSVLGSLPGVRADLVQPLVCVAGGHHVRGEVDGVTVCTPIDIVQWLSSRPAIFADADLAYVVHEARTRLRPVETSAVVGAMTDAHPTALE
ncbi:MAG: NERD domain-containing protein, partial [Nocardioides sp.]